MSQAFIGQRVSPRGIGGWLWAPLVNLIGNTGWLTYSLIVEMPGDAGAPRLGHGYTFFNAAFDLYGAACLVLLLLRKKAVPDLMAGFYLLMLAHAVWGTVLAMDTAQYPDRLVQLLATVMACGVWIPYFRVSQRVKNTFLR
jgi:hypothetical protein